MAKGNPHRMVDWRFSYTLCVHCGLLGLRNERSQQALRAPCPGKA